MTPILVIHRRSKDVTRENSIILPSTTDGRPILPSKGDQVTVDRVMYTVSHTHWDFDAMTITVYASRRDD